MIKYENGIWISTFEYDQRHIPKNASFRWDPDKKIWWTDNFRNAATLTPHLSAAAARAVEIFTEEAARAVEISRAVDADIEIPAPDGYEYFGYQKAGIQFAFHKANALIADEMGLGKTIQAIGVMNLKPETKRVLIVCPASLKLNWRNELRTWMVKTMPIYLLTTKHKQAMMTPGIFVVNYDILTKLEWLKKTSWDIIVADEVHAVKNNKAQRSKAFYSIAKLAAKRIYLTGTPILNKPIELFHILRSLGWSMSWTKFTERFCAAQNTRFGTDVSGASNLDELQDLLRQTVMIRRLKKDVLKDLPPKIHQIITLPEEKYTRFIQQEQQLELKHANERKRLNAIKDNYKGNKEKIEAAVETLRRFEMGAIGEIAKIRRELAVAKAPDVAEIIKEAIENGQNPIVFAHHKEVVLILEDLLKEFKIVKVTGGMDKADRQQSVEDFQAGKADIFIGSIRAAGVGLTLTRSNLVIFAEQDWTPGMMQQAEDRAHRIGQENSVLIQVIVVDGSIDAKMAKTLVKKSRIAKQALD